MTMFQRHPTALFDTEKQVPTINGGVFSLERTIGGEQMRAPPGLKGMTTENDESRNFGIGVSTSNLAQINTSLVMRSTARFPAHHTQREMLCFVENKQNGPLTNLKLDHEMPSVSALNAYLLSEEGRKIFGTERSCKKLLQHFAPLGSFNSVVPEYKQNTGHSEVSVITGRRARCTAITRAWRSRRAHQHDRPLDVVWYVIIRRKLTHADIGFAQASSSESASRQQRIDALKAETDKRISQQRSRMLDNRRDARSASSSSASSSSSSSSSFNYAPSNAPAPTVEFETPYPHYWGFYIMVTERNSPPPPWLYIDDESEGAWHRIGTVVQYSPNCAINEDHTQRARKGLSGIHNQMVKPADFLKLLETLPYVDLFLGQ
jgi:hypothetical protein